MVHKLQHKYILLLLIALRFVSWPDSMAAYGSVSYGRCMLAVCNVVAATAYVW